MKILHTGDWHLGHTLYGYDRTQEQEAMITRMADIVRKERPDAFLLCGDVYHTAQPSASVQTMLSDGLVKIHEACPEMVIAAIAGNHDSAAKHEIFRTPWRALKVFTIGALEKERIGEHIIEVPDKGFIIAMPYSSERNIPEGFFKNALDKVKELNINNLPIVMMAHATVKGCDFTGHDNASEFTVGGIDSFDLKEFGAGYDYLALGHIHHKQNITDNVRYCGAPLAVSFDERFSHSVSIVEIDSHGAVPKVQEIEIENLHPLVTLPATNFATWEDAKKLLQEYPNDIASYIRLNVEIDGMLPVEANYEAVKLTESKKCKFCCINAQRKQAKQSDAKILTVQEFQSEDPIDIARRYAQDTGCEFTDEMKQLFNEARKEVDFDTRK